MAKARYAIVHDGKVWSVTEWDAEQAPNWLPPVGQAVACGDSVATGDLYDGSEFTRPPVVDPIPDVISDRQFFEALAIEGHITQAEALDAVKTGEVPSTLAGIIDNIPDEAVKFNALMRLSGAVEFRYSHPLVAMLGAAMGWTEEQRANLWRLAASLD